MENPVTVALICSADVTGLFLTVTPPCVFAQGCIAAQIICLPGFPHLSYVHQTQPLSGLCSLLRINYNKYSIIFEIFILFSGFGHAKKRRTFRSSLSLMQKMGVEPTRYCYHTDLNRARLPIPPLLRTVRSAIAHRTNTFIISNII